uniref:Uncharacterized protein n=1 Tax=Nothoprocta perdicaria TaxID=30464 RepID=A0A8C6ZGZ0_NOTPE
QPWSLPGGNSAPRRRRATAGPRSSPQPSRSAGPGSHPRTEPGAHPSVEAVPPAGAPLDDVRYMIASTNWY